MVWDETLHPRDEKGRFTFGAGGSNEDSDSPVLKGRVEKTDTDSVLKDDDLILKTNKTKTNTSPADILYGESSKKEQLNYKYRNSLLNILGKLATPAMVLYATTKELENAVKINGLDKKLKQAKNTILQKGIEFGIGEKYFSLENKATSNLFGKDTAGMLDLAHGINMNDRTYIKDAISLDNYNDSKVETDKEYLRKKISEQFKDYNFDINKIKGYYFKPTSEPVQRLIKSKDFQDMIKNNKQEIIQKGEFSAEFLKHGKYGLGLDNNFRNAIGKADFRNIHLDKDGNLHVKMYDTYDFNKNEDSPLIKAGAKQMEKGNLKPYFTIHDIIIPKERLDEIWK